MKHPFTIEDIEAGRRAFLPNNLYSVEAMLQAVWNNAVARGAIRRPARGMAMAVYHPSYVFDVPNDENPDGPGYSAEDKS
jgi:hypothetical protein